MQNSTLCQNRIRNPFWKGKVADLAHFCISRKNSVTFHSNFFNLIKRWVDFQRCLGKYIWVKFSEFSNAKHYHFISQNETFFRFSKHCGPTGAKPNILSINYQEFDVWKLWIVKKWGFENVIFWKMWFSKCDFCQKWDFQNVNFCPNVGKGWMKIC